MVARTRYALPLPAPLAHKFDALEAVLDVHVLAASAGVRASDPRFHLVRRVRPRLVDGPLFYALLPVRVARELRRLHPDAVLVQGAQETALTLLGRALSRECAPVIADVHADPAAPTRLYGSRLRKALAPLADVLARLALRRADGVRTLSPFTSNVVREEAGREPTATFPAFVDVDAFLSEPAPLPERPVALFVGVLERYKGIDVLATAWRAAAQRLPDAELHVVGSGTLAGEIEDLLAELPDRTRWTERLPTDAIARALDDATVLVLPSRAEGLPRIVIEASCRKRGFVATTAGGIPDLVRDGENGLLVPDEDPDALADALVRVLGDRALAERFGDAARAAIERWLTTPEEYARRVRDLVDTVVSD
jgi:glycosyltransferase involved in cell wall biosynthesis